MDISTACERYEFVVPDGIQPQRLDAYLATLLSPLSRTRIAELIDHAYVAVEGLETRPAHRIQGGESIVVVVPAASNKLVEPVEMDISVLYEDEHVAVIDKPPGLVIHPGAGTTEPTLVHGLLHRYPELSRMHGDPDRPGIVHRLDKDTSGCLIVARSDIARRTIIDDFVRHDVHKEYYALVSGVPAEDCFCIDKDIGRSSHDRKKMSVTSTNGRFALSHVSVQDTFGNIASGLVVRILTGRTHQIRVHLAFAGFPVLGDATYGRRTSDLSREVGAMRQMLHAHKLTFKHPVSRRELTFVSPIPEDIESVIAALRRRG